MLETVSISIVSTLIGAALAFPIAFIAASNFNTNRISLSLIRIIATFIRSLPVLIYAFLFTLVFGFNAFSGALALTLLTFARLLKFFYEKIEATDLRSFESVYGIGVPFVSAIILSFLPKVRSDFFSKILYHFEINLRGSTILGYVGAGGVGTLLRNNLQSRQYSNVSAVLLVIFLVFLVFEIILRVIKKRYL
jgi:phosphonate transport system permease protein